MCSSSIYMLRLRKKSSRNAQLYRSFILISLLKIMIYDFTRRWNCETSKWRPRRFFTHSTFLKMQKFFALVIMIYILDLGSFLIRSYVLGKLDNRSRNPSDWNLLKLRIIQLNHSKVDGTSLLNQRLCLPWFCVLPPCGKSFSFVVG